MFTYMSIYLPIVNIGKKRDVEMHLKKMLENDVLKTSQ